MHNFYSLFLCVCFVNCLSFLTVTFLIGMLAFFLIILLEFLQTLIRMPTPFPSYITNIFSLFWYFYIYYALYIFVSKTPTIIPSVFMSLMLFLARPSRPLNDISVHLYILSIFSWVF